MYVCMYVCHMCILVSYSCLSIVAVITATLLHYYCSMHNALCIIYMTYLWSEIRDMYHVFWVCNDTTLIHVVHIHTVFLDSRLILKQPSARDKRRELLPFFAIILLLLTTPTAKSWCIWKSPAFGWWSTPATIPARWHRRWWITSQ